LEQTSDSQWKKVDGSYHHNKIQFSENTGSVMSASSAQGTAKLYFDDSVMDNIVTEMSTL
jgi:hypothetical protein